MQRDKPHEKIEKPDPKCCYLKLEMGLRYPIRSFTLQISDYHAYEDCNAGKEANQIQNVDG